MKKMTHDDKLKLLGLRTLADHHNRALVDIAETVREILGHPDDPSGWVSDFVYGEDITPQELWERSGAGKAPAR